MLLEKDGVVFKAEAYYWPTRVWSVGEQKWKPYTLQVPKPQEWADEISAYRAKEFMAPFDA
jgi:hypothetical protein